MIVDYEPNPLDKAYAQGYMDCLGSLRLKGVISEGDAEFGRLGLAESVHTHYQSMMGPYCVVCHIGIDFPYKLWSDGQKAV